jgi:hypothetical protein
LIKVTFGVIVLSLIVVLGGSPAWGGEAVLLNDAQLDQVYGGETSGDVINCTSLVCNSSPGSSVSLSGSAQANTNAMIIVNNAGGVVSAQVNVIVNNGNGTPTQTNMAFNTVGP